eukprot:2641844-Pyramimonas_sp.AAC.1
MPGVKRFRWLRSSFRGATRGRDWRPARGDARWRRRWHRGCPSQRAQIRVGQSVFGIPKGRSRTLGF